MRGRLFAVVGPSGAGKDTLLAGVCGGTGPHWVRRVITRPSAAGGEPFEGVDAVEFDRREAEGAFALTWRAHGLAYGIPAAELAPLEAGRDVVFNGSRAALEQAAAAFPALQVIVVTAPVAVLATRLAGRGRESAAQIAERLARDVAPLPPHLPVIEIVNDTTPAAGIARLKAALQPSLARRS
ncbi:phosphonate metabolism protein/1,5-bisphosphokinase (PRPP-forming) PhnN [Pararhodobacter zhoushanensis]|uniref:phosphonate metabolism protein/1,5-bisphosphokinase (PRPP-forming) PhnN n=1 Tax=Pararhodobacter zhoushanensis TaxID=2479545 RepID=UPI000F8F2FB3|nr:phosphonate metabolism protein/1,5-bisphosphokinase (PRPP-forming) PhnN [Pararhodobacter zhoushanensis]